ncbi:MAG: hypothetical protein WC709_06160 [Thermoleophilia bacterium]
MIAALLPLAEAGPGSLSLDASLGAERDGVRWLAAALTLGAAGSLATLELARRQAAAASEGPRPA